MAKAFEVMTRALATCAPDTTVAEVAATMRDRDIGTVLIMKNGAIDGIVTDRDLATRALADHETPSRIPVSSIMTTQVLTGNADWSLERVSEFMAQHQIRRLPIVEDGEVRGIISLGDLARSGAPRHAVAGSLRAISEPAHTVAGIGGGKVLATLAVTASAATAFAIWALRRTLPFGQRRSGMMALYEPIRERLARVRMNGPATGFPARRIRQSMIPRLGNLLARVPSAWR